MRNRYISLFLVLFVWQSVAGQRLVRNKQVKFVHIPAGTFMMGDVLDDEVSDEELPVHSVTLHEFWMSVYEITNTQFCVFLNDQGNRFEAGCQWLDIEHDDCLIENRRGTYIPKPGYGDYPVVTITWYGANAYAHWLGGRLPTEAEWEYAARNGGENIRFVNGMRLSRRYSNVDGIAGLDIWSRLAPVGELAASKFGLYDLIGNVWEYCSDWYDPDYYSVSPDSDPGGPFDGSLKIIRGGSWKYARWNCRIATRGRLRPSKATNDTGFRVILDATSVAVPEVIQNSPLFGGK